MMGRAGFPHSRRQFLWRGLALAGLGLLAGCGIGPPAPQPRRVPRVGFLCPGCPSTLAGQPTPGSSLAALVDALCDLGYVDGQTVAMEYRGADGRNERLAGLAAELIALPVDVIVTSGGTPAHVAAKQSTATVPIVFTAVGDPVGTGLVESLRRPGGNATGTSNFSPETVGKRLELLKEIIPTATRVEAVYNFGNPAAVAEWDDMQDAARRLGLAVQQKDVRDIDQAEAALAAMASNRPDAVLLAGDSFLFANRRRLLDRAVALRLPTFAILREFAADGALMSYGPNLNDLFRKAAPYVDKILKGAKPADLPVEGPTTFDFVLNLKTAQALGLTIPLRILQQATEVIH